MRTYVLFSLAFGNLAIGIGALVIAGIIRPMASGLGVSIGEIGQLVTVYALVYAVGSPLLIAATAAASRKGLLVAGMGLVMLGNLLGALAPGYGVVAAARVVAALGAAIYTPVASSVAASVSPPERRGQAIGVVFGGLTVATALGVPLGTFIGLRAGWRATLVLVAIVSLCAAAALVRALPASIATPRVDLRTWGQLLGRGALLLAVSVTLVQTTAQFAVFTYVSPVLGRALALGPTGITLMLLGFGAASVFGNLLAGFAADAWGALRTAALTLVLLTAALCAMSFIGGALWLALLAMVVWGAAGFGFHTPQQARLVALAPSVQGAILSLNASALYLGTAAGATLGGIIVGFGAYDGLGLVGGGVATLALALLLVSARMSSTSSVALPGSAVDPRRKGVQSERRTSAV